MASQKYSMRDIENRVFDSVVSGLQVVLAGQDITLLTKKTGTDVSRSVLASGTTITAGATWQSDWLEVNGYSKIAYLISASCDDSFNVTVDGTNDKSTIYGDQPFRILTTCDEVDIAPGSPPVAIRLDEDLTQYNFYRLNFTARSADVTLNQLTGIRIP